jgi:diguanylate cyclase (GGDEF)-like protein
MDELCIQVPDPAMYSAEREALLKTVSGLQEMVARRAPLSSVYQAVVDGAIGLLGAEIASLRFRDRADPSWTIAVATRPSLLKESWHARAPISEGVSGRAIALGELVAVDDLQPTVHGSRIAPATQRAAMAAPLFEGERIVGSLLVACNFKRDWQARERALLRDFARHAGALLALARAADAVTQAFTDPLTGLGNRAFLLDRLEYELGRADRARRLVTVLFVDLDRFKPVNDSLGHLVGDELLTAVAQRLRGCVRAEDACARVGGDEFAVLLADGGEPSLIADRIVAALGERFELAGHEISISASVGIATGCEDAETVLRNADLAMYAAKRRGAARYERFDPRTHKRVVARHDLGTELRRAIERDELDVRYEPIVDLPTGSIAAFEALVRWHHPVRGTLSAAEFAPLPEQTGLAVNVGCWVLERAAADLGTHSVAISLNVSTRELADPRYLGAVRSTTAAGVLPSNLILELSATATLADTRDALANLDALQALGIRIALDDFGTGPTSLLELTTLPLDLLKIGLPFIPGDPARKRTTALLPAIITIARRLGLESIAQGLDHPEQLSVVKDLGCALGQGALHGAAVDASTAHILLASRPCSERLAG